MGEISYLLAMAPSPGRDVTDILRSALKYYLRSIELCEDYLRGYYGLVVVCGKLLKEGKLEGKLDRGKVEGLYGQGRRRLEEIVARARRREKGWEGYDEGEVEAAKKLLEEIGDVQK